MVKPKQKESASVPKVKKELTAQEKFLKRLDDNFANIETRMNNMQKQISASNTRTKTVAKKASEEPKPIDIMGIFKEVNDFLNGPLGTKIVDGIFGATEEASAAPPPPPAVDAAELKKVNAYYEKQVKFVDRMTEAIVAKAEAETKMAKKRAESDFI